MQFNTLIELADYLLANDLKMSDLGIMVSHNNGDKQMITDKGIEDDNVTDDGEYEKIEPEIKETTFTNFISKPTVPTTVVTEGENVLTVTSVEVFKDVCGTGSLKIGDSVTLMNICESAGKISAKLSFMLGEQEYKDVEFEIKVGPSDSAIINETTLQ